MKKSEWDKINYDLFNLIIEDKQIIFEFKKQDFVNMFEGLYGDFESQIMLMKMLTEKYKKPAKIKIN